jgi:hypothetical protein
MTLEQQMNWHWVIVRQTQDFLHADVVFYQLKGTVA